MSQNYEQIVKEGIAETEEGNLVFPYFVQPVLGISPNLAKALTKTITNNGKQLWGILDNNQNIVWTNDNNVVLHGNLAIAEKSEIVAQFQTYRPEAKALPEINKAVPITHEVLPIIYVGALERYLPDTLRYILASGALAQHKLTVQIVHGFPAISHPGKTIYEGRLGKVKTKISF